MANWRFPDREIPRRLWLAALPPALLLQCVIGTTILEIYLHWPHAEREPFPLPSTGKSANFQSLPPIRRCSPIASWQGFPCPQTNLFHGHQDWDAVNATARNDVAAPSSRSSPARSFQRKLSHPERDFWRLRAVKTSQQYTSKRSRLSAPLDLASNFGNSCATTVPSAPMTNRT